MGRPFLGEFEQMVLVAILHLGNEVYGPGIAAELEERAGRQVSRGALYATLDRLQKKGLLRWEIEAATSERSGNRRRRFELTPEGLKRDADVDRSNVAATAASRRLDIATIVVALVAVGLFALDRFVWQAVSQPDAPPSDSKSIAVLPFVNTSADEEQERAAFDEDRNDYQPVDEQDGAGGDEIIGDDVDAAAAGEAEAESPVEAG